MASIEEVYEQVVASDDEKAAFAEAAQSKEGLAAFLSARGCEATGEEVAELLRNKQGELADEELDSVAGGCFENMTRRSIEKCEIACEIGLY